MLSNAFPYMEYTACHPPLLPTPLWLHYPHQYNQFLFSKAQLCTCHSLHLMLLHWMMKLLFHPFNLIVLGLMMPWVPLLGGHPGGRAKPKKSKFHIQNIDISCTAVVMDLLNSVLMMLNSQDTLTNCNGSNVLWYLIANIQNSHCFTVTGCCECLNVYF